MLAESAGPESRTENRRPPPGRATRAAVGLTLLLLALLSLLASVLVWQSHREMVAATEARAQSGAHIASAHVRWLVEAGMQALRRVDESLGRRPEIFLAGTVSDLDDAIAALPGDILVRVFDPQGRLLLTNDRDIVPGNVVDRTYFRELSEGQDWHISPLLTDRLTERQVFVIGRRIERDGTFVGVAAIVVPAELMSQVWVTMALGPDSSVGLIRDDGWLVARYPVPPEAIDLSRSALFQRHLPTGPSGIYHSDVSPADGIARVVGYRRVDGLPLIAVAGVSLSAAESEFWRRIGAFMLVAVPIGLALLGSSLWVASLLRREERIRADLATALERNRMLLRESHHRVKNNLQTVAALVRLQPGPAEAKDELGRRIAAMTALHEQIYEADQFGSLEIADYIGKLVAGLELGSARNVRVQCDLTPMEIDVDAALPLGLIVNEAVSNALKHAFPENRPGRVTVTLTPHGAHGARLRVVDDGVGFAPQRQSTGMGTRLIQGLSAQIGGRYSFEKADPAEGGTVFVLDFPLARAAA